MRRPGLAACAALVALATAATALAGTLPPRRKGRLLRWLQAGTYRITYLPEPAIHPSTPAHGLDVRTWFSPRLVEDLQHGRTRFRKGAAMVKELYFEGAQTPVGWAVMRKVRRRSGRKGRGWWFYETFDGTNRSAIAGRGERVHQLPRGGPGLPALAVPARVRRLRRPRRQCRRSARDGCVATVRGVEPMASPSTWISTV